jgi:hypothetical protein
MVRSAGVPEPVPLLLELGRGSLGYVLSREGAGVVWSELPWRWDATATAMIGARVRGLTKKRWVRLGVA